jgi:hypothetical protein
MARDGISIIINTTLQKYVTAWKTINDAKIRGQLEQPWKCMHQMKAPQQKSKINLKLP